MWDTIIPAAASIFGSIMQAEGQDDANDANRQIQENNNAFNAEQAAINRTFNQGEAAENRNFQLSSAREQMQFQQGSMREQMAFQQHNANTVWQRGVEDMKAAGLNPMLAYRQGGNPTATGSAPGGASGSGAQASGQNATAGSPGNQMNKFANATQSASQIAQIQNIEADTEVKKEEAELKRDQQNTEKGRPANLAADTDRIRKQAELYVRQHGLTNAQTDKVAAEIESELRRPHNIDASTENLKADTALKNINAILQKHDIPRMKAEDLYFRSSIGQTSPHNKYGPQTPFRLLEGIGERIFNDNSANSHRLRLYPPDGGQRKPW